MNRALCLLIAWAAAWVAAPAQAEDPATVSVMSRMTMVVADIEASKRFYAYGLGWAVTRDAPIADKITFKHLGLPDTHTARIVVVEPGKSL